MILFVKRLPNDDFGRPRLQNIATKRIYADVSCGDPENYPHQTGRNSTVPGCWHSISRDGEPDVPLRADIVFILVE